MKGEGRETRMERWYAELVRGDEGKEKVLERKGREQKK